MAEWYYIGHYGQLGPLNLDQIEELIQGGVIVRETYVWGTGMAAWLPAEQVAELRPSFQSGPAMAPPPPPAGFAPTPVAPPSYSPEPMTRSYPAPSMAGFATLKSDRSRVASGILNILIPGVGRMYLGYAAIGVLQLVATICSFGILILWPIIDGILILSGTVKVDGYGRALGD